MDLGTIEAEIKTQGATREFLTEVMIGGVNLPGSLKALAYTYLQQMTEDQVISFGPIILKVVELLRAGNTEGLRAYLTELSIPEPIIGIIANASGYKNQD